MMGIIKAKVFPLPVTASAATSLSWIVRFTGSTSVSGRLSHKVSMMEAQKSHCNVTSLFYELGYAPSLKVSHPMHVMDRQTLSHTREDVFICASVRVLHLLYKHYTDHGMPQNV
ncbi:hypothetical protein E2C01_013258 [Portunus trituberculatus]|uniref:Uncharacterized protein n=1 Tax=Portunus trituberculatus TaxID=210409 RepID=A0A5B7DFS9_PORTR|nr:hypothetical protein [Portunus trituberculatus]